MVKRTEEEIRLAMQRINWDFEDYSSSKYPLDLNSIPWYPATFPAPIPKYLIALLSEAEDTVFDPFGGKGTTAVEALKQRRQFIYNDLNPHAVIIMQCIFEIIGKPREDSEFRHIVEVDQKCLTPASKVFSNYQGKNDDYIFEKLPKDINKQLLARGIKPEVVYWFHAETLKDMIKIYDHIESFHGFQKAIRKLAFLSILKEMSSQRGHFSYVTDNCKPAEMRYYNAVNSYLEMLDRIQRACVDFNRQYIIMNKRDDLEIVGQKCIIHSGNSRKCEYIPDSSVDLIITSPPYLCAQDYILTMRLNDYFYHDEGFDNLPFQEMGPRRLRTRNGIVDSYFNDMELVLNEMYRVLKNNAYFCLVIGQGKGKVSDNVNVIKKVVDLAEKTGFIKIFNTTRNISYRTNRIGGVDKEDLILMRK